MQQFVQAYEIFNHVINLINSKTLNIFEWSYLLVCSLIKLQNHYFKYHDNSKKRENLFRIRIIFDLKKMNVYFRFKRNLIREQWKSILN